jgi:hypothetical protein
MKKLLSTLTVMVFTIFAFNSYSQSTISLHAGPAFATGDFGDGDFTNSNKTSGAGVGLNVGGKFVNTLNDKGLGLFLSGELNYNGLNSDAQDFFDKLVDGADVTYMKFINVPLMGGLNFTIPANDKVSLFGEAGLGLDILKVTDMTFSANGNDAVMSFEMSTALGFKFGGGLIIDDKYIISLHYNTLGEHKIKSSLKADGDTQDQGTMKREVTILALTIGMKL